MANLRKIPFLHNLGLSTIMNNIGLSKKNKGIIYNMAIDEAGYNPEMSNKGSILKALLDYGMGKNKSLIDSLGMSLENMYRWSDEDFKRFGTKRKISKEQTLNMINRLDKEYNIYSDEALPVINKIINENLLNFSNLKNLYQEKYKDKYKVK